MEVVENEVKQDEDLKKIIKELKQKPEETSKFQWENGKLLYKKRVVLSKTSSLIPTLLRMFHDSVLGGHSGFLRTYKRMSGELHWKGMKADVKKYVEQCEACQRNKYEATKPAGVFQPIPISIPERILEDWSMDFI